MKEKDAYYFPHDCNARNDYKLLRLRAQFGWEGYGIYFAIIEILREQTHFKLGKESTEALSTAIGKPLEWMQDFVSNLIRLKLLCKEDGGGLYSESLITRMQFYTDQKEFYREMGRRGAKAKKDKRLSPLKPPASIKVNKIKVNKIKDTTTKEPVVIVSNLSKIGKLFISTWQRNPKNMSETLAVEKMFYNYQEKHIIQAFRRAAEMDVMTVAYVKGILKKHSEKLAANREIKEAKKKSLEAQGINLNV